MSAPWYVYVILAVIAVFLERICEKFHIIKSKTLRYFIVTLVTVFVGLIIYDIAIAPK